MSRYAVRIGSALALLIAIAVLGAQPARSADRAAFTFQGKRIVFAHLIAQDGGRAIPIDDPGIRALFEQIGATVTWQPGERYVLVTTAQPVVVSFAIGDRRYDVGPVTETADFAPFLLGGHPYVPFDELLQALGLSEKTEGSTSVLQPQLASIDFQSGAQGAKMIARGGMPLDARIVSDSGGKIVLAFDGVGSTLPPARTVEGGPVHRIDVRTEGSPSHPRTLVTLYVGPGTAHSALGTDDQRDVTVALGAAQTIAAAKPPPSPVPVATPSGPVQPAPAQSGLAQVTAVQTQPQDGAYVVRVAVSGNASYDWHRLRPPDNRWWIDIHGARLAMPPAVLSGNAIVTSVRVRRQSGDAVRVALSPAGFYAIDVTPDAGGVTITVRNAIADAASRSGSGTIGTSAIAYASAPAPAERWKFSPRPTPAAYVSANPRLIVIDPGHGGSDWGSIRGDAVEKTLSLDMSKRLRDVLVARGWQVMMTRDTDKDVYAPYDSASDELQARDDVANNNGARLFVSIHVNAFMNSGPHGATVYYYKPSDLALAQAVEHRIAAEAGIADDGTVKDKLYVVHHATMPATLVETAFISNPDDRQLLQSPQWRERMAQAIADGIADYAGPPPPAAGSNGQ